MNERGDASVEFLGILVVVVIPVLYIVLAISQVSAGAMAVDAGAREAARILAEDPERTADASHAVTLIVVGSGVNAEREVAVTRENFQVGEGAVDVRVSVQVPLPFIPSWLGDVGVGVSSSARAPVREVVARD